MTISLKRILYTIAVVIFLIAWLVRLGTIDWSGTFWQPGTLTELGLAVGFAGFAVNK